MGSQMLEDPFNPTRIEGQQGSVQLILQLQKHSATHVKLLEPRCSTLLFEGDVSKDDARFSGRNLRDQRRRFIEGVV